MRKKPNFLIIGSPKSGTTSLYQYLSQHPKIEFSSLKEPKYFCWKDRDLNFNGNDKVLDQIQKSAIQDFNTYKGLFEKKNAAFVGEASADYFHHKVAPGNIQEFNPDMKLILILRNPVDRAYSDWRHNLKMGYENIKYFKKALKRISYRKAHNFPPYFDYLAKGNYATHLTRYLNYFEASNIRVLFFEDLKMDANAVCNEILGFLGMNESFSFDTEKIHMKSNYLPRYYKIHKLVKKLGSDNLWMNSLKKLNAIPTKINNRDKGFLTEYYREEVLELEKITGRDLSHWLA